MTIPSIDQNICGSWNEQQRTLYHKLDLYLMEGQAAYRKHWAVHSKLLNSIPWKPNQGDTMRRVAAEPAPVLRQEAYPQLISSDPNTDIINYRERHADAQIRWQDFVTPHFSFLPEFVDFMKHVDKTMENLNRQISIFEDIFYRTMLYHWAPYVYVVGVGLVPAPQGTPNAAGTAGKTFAWLQNEVILPLMAAQPGHLTFQELFKILNAAEQEVGMTPFEGSGMPSGDSAPLNEKFILVNSPEVWNNFVDDPWVKENRPLGMNIVTESYKGDFFGRIRDRQERWALRYAINENGLPSIPVPETVEENPAREDFGRTKPNLPYAQVAGSPVEVAFLYGGNVAEYINVGPPPSSFTKELDQGAAVKMNWNGKAYLTKEFLVPCKDAGGVTRYEANSFGRYLRGQATLSCGISIMNSFNVLPIIFKRRVGVSTQS